ncbi:NADPH-dependent F420 reductase [Burkholderia contaminans]|uniref:NADPH-dependent F420 reductase n=1 Tax=Burkholderia contaminans TaxID=488447 RepID=UPI0024463F20|nr:NAD(P)-binding domain-containing protein [Burkholderia contaminans]
MTRRADETVLNEVSPMEIGIIGTGNIGGTLARRLKAAGHNLRIANSKGPEDVQSFANEIGALAVDVAGAVRGADAIILAIPLPAMAKLPPHLFDAVLANVPIIDTSNHYPGLRDPRIADIDGGMPESVWVSHRLGRRVIKAFNNILAYSLAEHAMPEGTPGRLAVAVAGDEGDAKQVAMALVDAVGFDPVDAGSLEESWRQQPSTPAYCCDWDAPTTRAALAAAIRGDAAAKRDRMPEQFAKLGADPRHEDIVRMNRGANAIDGFDPC